MAPIFFASSMACTDWEMEWFFSISTFTWYSTLRISSAVIPWKWVKSKRSPSGATRDPCCCTCSPRTLRRAACRRWVALWLRTVRNRFSASTVACTAFRVSAESRPFTSSALCTTMSKTLMVSTTFSEVRDPAFHGGAEQGPGIAHLAAGLGVEGGLVQDQQHLVADLAEAEDLDVRLEAVIAQELGLEGRGEEGPALVAGEAAVELGGAAGAFPLLLHVLGVAGLVDGEALLLGQYPGQIRGEAVGVVQGEDLDPAHRGPFFRLHVLGDLGEAVQALVEGAHEAILLGADHLLDIAAALHDLGEGPAHHLAQGGDELPDEALLLPQVGAGEAAGAAQDAAQHVAAALVAGRGAVGDGEGKGAQVIGDDAVGSAFRALGVGDAGQGRDLLDDGAEDVGLVIRAAALDDGADALEAHARVHVLALEGLELAAFQPLALHEHVVPDLDVAGIGPVHPLDGVRIGGLAGRGVAHVEMDFRAGAAGSHLAHLPEVRFRRRTS